MKRFVVKIEVRDGTRKVVQTRYFSASGENGSEAIQAAKEQMGRESEPGEGKRASYHAKPCPPGVVNPW